MFDPHSRMRCDLDRDQRQFVLIPKQRVGAICNRQPAFHPGVSGQEKNGATAHPGYECQRVMRPDRDLGRGRRAGAAASGQALVCVASARLKRLNISKKCL